MHNHISLDETIEQMRAMGEQLVPYNSPVSESDLYVMKTRDIFYEGYEMVLYYPQHRNTANIWKDDALFAFFPDLQIGQKILGRGRTEFG